MERSTRRILTTHAGSLPRPDDLLADPPGRGGARAARLRSAVRDVVRRQIETGLDVVDDGELGKPGFIHYVTASTWVHACTTCSSATSPTCCCAFAPAPTRSR